MMIHQRAALYKIMLSFTLATDRPPSTEEKRGMIADISRLPREDCIDVVLLTEQVIAKQIEARKTKKRRMH